MQIKAHTIEIWSANLKLLSEQEQLIRKILDTDECNRADHFRAAIHRQRFIAARGVLRYILSQYTGMAPQAIKFIYNEHKKPALADSDIHFNLAHSEDLAVYAFGLNKNIGIDIELIKDNYNPAVAKRFFSQAENDYLTQLPEAERVAGFYQLWARKEAVTKAIGSGLSIGLDSFSVSGQTITETITVAKQPWYLYPLTIQPGFASALAS